MHRFIAGILSAALALAPASAGQMSLLGAGLPVAAGGSFAAFDPANTGATQVLSNSNRTVTGAGGNGIANTVTQKTGGSGPKVYFEFTTGAAVANSAAGFSAPPTPNTTFLQDQSSFGVGYGGAWGGFALTGTCTAQTLVPNHTYGVASDFTAFKAWMKDLTAAGNWNNNGTADPATGVNGCDFSAGFSGKAISAAFTAANAGETATFNFGNAAYVGTVPSGYGNW